MPTLTLSDNSTIEYRRLGLFELYDNVPFEPMGHFKYSILTITGVVIEQEIDLSEITTPPTPPDDPEPATGTPAYWQLKEYEIYVAALAHERKRAEQNADHLHRCAVYILANCVSPEDWPKIATAGDYDKLFTSVTVPQLSQEGLQAELTRFFQGHLQWIRPIRLPVRPTIIEVPQPGPVGVAADG